MPVSYGSFEISDDQPLLQQLATDVMSAAGVRTRLRLLALLSALSTAAGLAVDIPTFQPTEWEEARCSAVVAADAARAQRSHRLLSTRRRAALQLSQAVAVARLVLLARPLLLERLERLAGCTEAETVAAAEVAR